MDPKKTPDDEVAAIDAVFEEWPANPVKPAPPAAKPETSAPPTPSSEAASRLSPRKDYLRELQEEFEEQEDEGKL